MNQEPKKPRKPRRQKLQPGCVYMKPGESQCCDTVYAHNHCRAHLHFSPEERQNLVELRSALDKARHDLADCGETLLNRVVFGDGEIPEELRREYRNFWYRNNYLVQLARDRRPGDELPAEIHLR